MKRKILLIIFIVVILVATYWCLGLAGYVPILHCDTAMGEGGLIKWCEWYAGWGRIY